MDKIIPYTRKLMFVVSVVIIAYYTYVNISEIEITTDTTIKLFNVITDSYYENITDNSGYTNINGVSNICLNLISEGYSIYDVNTTDNYLDISFVKQDCPSYRIYYLYDEQYIAFFSSIYETSYDLNAYINNKEK